MAGKTITLFLVDGTPSGIRKAQIANWTGVAFLVPRASIEDLPKREESKKTGVYLLVNTDDDNIYTDVYVGESEIILERVKDHLKEEKDFSDIVFFSSKDDNLTKAHIKWLEHKLYTDIKNSKICSLMNRAVPTCSNLPEESIADMEDYYTYMKMLLPIFGYNIIVQDKTKISYPTFIYKNTHSRKIWNAKLELRDGSYYILKDSLMSKTEVDSVTNYISSLREKLLDEGVIVVNDNKTYIFIEDYRFEKPTTAANVVYGGSVSGRSVWKQIETDISLPEWEEQQLLDDKDSPEEESN